MDVTASPKAAQPSQHGGYALHPEVFSSEDILFCFDAGPETMVEMKVNGPNGRTYTRLNSIKQAILLFINALLTPIIDLLSPLLQNPLIGSKKSLAVTLAPQLQH